MRLAVWAGLGLCVIMIAAATWSGAAQKQDPSEEAVSYLARAIAEYPIVALAEGNHSCRQPHEFLRRVLTDDEVMKALDVIIVEFATELQQPVLDAFIAGEDVSFADLSRVWRDASTSTVNPWDSPLYFEFLRVIREANQTLPPEQRVRVLAGDPPFEWENITTHGEFVAAMQPRDPYVARVAVEQAFALDKKVLIVFGGAHLPRVPVGGPDNTDDLRNSLSHWILAGHPGSMKVVGFLNLENLGLADRGDEFVPGRIYDTARHWVGEMTAENFFPNVYSAVTDPRTGEVSWQDVPLYADYRIRDLFDALVYIGPASEWEVVPVLLDDERDADYLIELERRRAIRFGQVR